MTCMRDPQQNAYAWLAALVLCTIAASPVAGQDGAEQDQADAAPAPQQTAEESDQKAPKASTPAALVRVRLPLTGSADSSVQRTLTRSRDRLLEAARATGDARRPVLVIELVPGSSVSEGGRFERSLAVARFLGGREMAGVKTVAFLPRTVEGHGVLLAMACEEIVMAPAAEIGNAPADDPQGEPVSETVVAAYREIANSTRTVPEALALGMVDPGREVLEVETEQGLQFVFRRDLEEFTKTRELIRQSTVIPRGSTGPINGKDGRRFGFVKYLARDTGGLARSVGVAEDSLTESGAIGDAWRPVVVDLTGPITPRVARRVETLVGMELDADQADRANWVALRIDSLGGDLVACVDLARWLANLDHNSVRTVAYVPVEARGGAALVALACDEIVLQEGSALGVGPSLETPDEAMLANAEAVLTEVALNARRTWSLMAAMINPAIDLSVYRQAQTGETRIMSRDEAASLPDAAAWAAVGPALADDGPLVFTPDAADRLGLADHVVASFDELQERYLLGEPPKQLKPNLALEFVEALAAPELGAVLIMVGIMGVYFELRMPGVGVGGFVASVAFLLFFWSNFLNGTAGWLEVLLFVAGIGFLLLEIFVLPGFGIFGLGGAAMIVASLVLASLTFVVPASDGELQQLVRSIGSVALATIAFVVIGFASRRLIFSSPMYKEMVLDAATPEEKEIQERRETLADYSHLLGQTGSAATDLRPAGKADIDGELLDVIAEADIIDKGTPIVVVDTQATRVVVRRA
ncbi:MAG: NfeD family protein [Planctomycetota bacterium]